MDYGFHVLCKLIGIITMAICWMLLLGKELGYGVCAYFGGLFLLLLIRFIKRKSDSKIKKVIIGAEMISSACIILSIVFKQSAIFFFPFIVFSIFILCQIILYCLNFADSIDQTFVFKLVNGNH